MKSFEVIRTKVKPKYIIIISSVIALASILYVGFGTSFYSDIRDRLLLKENTITTTNSNDPSSITEPIKGNYNGTFSMFDGIIQFPTSSLVFDDEDSITITAQNFDLIILQDLSLQVNGVYPLMSLQLSGTITKSSDNNTVKLTINSLDITYSIANQPVDSNLYSGFNSTLSTLLKTDIQNIVPTSPLTIDISIITTASRSITLNTFNNPEPNSDKQVYISFEGSKE